MGGVCSYAPVCWHVEKEACIPMYKKAFRARHGDLDLLTSATSSHIAIAMAAPKYSRVFLILGV